jgi:hypothetical protein
MLVGGNCGDQIRREWGLKTKRTEIKAEKGACQCANPIAADAWVAMTELFNKELLVGFEAKLLANQSVGASRKRRATRRWVIG